MQRQLEASEERVKAARCRANTLRMLFSKCEHAIGRGHNRCMADGSIARFEKVTVRVGSKQRAIESTLEAPRGGTRCPANKGLVEWAVSSTLCET